MAESTPAAERLTLAAIVDAAAEIVARDGFDGLSMRKLAGHCGVGAMTLYGYVATKDDLLAALADRFLSDVKLPRDAARHLAARRQGVEGGLAQRPAGVLRGDEDGRHAAGS